MKRNHKNIHFLLNKLQPSLHSQDRLRFILRQQNRSYQFIYLARSAARAAALLLLFLLIVVVVVLWW